MKMLEKGANYVEEENMGTWKVKVIELPALHELSDRQMLNLKSRSSNNLPKLGRTS